MKKKLAVLILSIVCAFSLGVFLVAGCEGCDDEVKPEPTTYQVEFTSTERVGYKCTDLGEEAVSDGKVTVESGYQIKFEVLVEEGYTQDPQVTANGTAISARNGVYTYKVEADTVFAVAAVSEVAHSLSGEGTSENPYLLTSVKDLIFMAEKINEGTTVKYIQGYYKLANDIDCGGQDIEVIGNGATVNSFFGGYFDGDGHTVSNFKINSQGRNYVGLFGYAQASGTGNALGTIINLNIKDFDIDAHAPEGSSVFVGSFYGYGVAVNLINCSAVNGVITIYGNNYFCYAGGAVGIQQSAVVDSDGIYPFYSVTNYVSTQVDIYPASGYIYAAGGISGWVVSDHEFSPSIVSNCYATGNIYGAIRAGGVVGNLGDYSSIKNCYATGDVQATVNGNSADHDYDACAGGVVGYAGVDSVVADSFSISALRAEAALGSDYEKTGGIVASFAEPSAAFDRTLVTNCYYGSEANGESVDFVKNTLKWNEIDWVIAEGKLPVTNLSDVNNSVSVNITLNYGDNKIDGKSSKVVNVPLKQNYYSPMSNYYLNGQIEEAVVADNGKTSYGYYLDGAYTQRVPYGYVPVGDMTLYVAFADYGEVAGVYYYEYNGRTVEIELETSGSYSYIDGLRYSSSYRYNGENILLYDAIFARLSDTVIDEAPNDNYEPYRFFGISEEGLLKIYDGVYFTDKNPLVLTKNAPVKSGDDFKGVWEKSATINKKYTFDGNGNWSYSFKGGEVSNGTYTVSDGVATLSNGSKAKLDASGLLLIDDEYFCLEGSMFGVWFSNNGSGDYVRFDGYGGDCYGDAVIKSGSVYYELKYIKDGFFGENALTLLNGYSLFGYLECGDDGILTGVLYSSAAGGFAEYSFYLVDDYSGNWIGEQQIGGVNFKLMNFNGLGIYEVETDGEIQKLGYIEINGEKVAYTASVENGLAGTFEYKGKTYSLVYDDVNKKITVSDGTDSANLVRMDELYSYTLVSTDNKLTLTFDGGGYLNDGGTVTVKPTSGEVAQFGYKINKFNLDNKDIDVDIFTNGVKSGSITVSNNRFRYVNGGEDKQLEIKSPFSGAWSVGNNMWSNFTVGNFDLNFTSTGHFWAMETEATYNWNEEAGYISLSYIDENMAASTMLYVLYLQDRNVVVSTYPYFVPNGLNYYACLTDELSGNWYNSLNSNIQLSFDGLADSKYTNGIAFDGKITYLYTRRFGKIYMWDYTDESKMYVIEYVSYLIKDENVFNNGGRRAIRLVEFNAETTPVAVATDAEGTEYEIFLDGTLNIGNVNATYTLLDVVGSKTTMLVVLNGEEMTVVIDHDEKTATVLD